MHCYEPLWTFLSRDIVFPLRKRKYVQARTLNLLLLACRLRVQYLTRVTMASSAALRTAQVAILVGKRRQEGERRRPTAKLSDIGTCHCFVRSCENLPDPGGREIFPPCPHSDKHCKRVRQHPIVSRGSLFILHCVCMRGRFHSNIIQGATRIS